jgi:hypothetical protein
LEAPEKMKKAKHNRVVTPAEGDTLLESQCFLLLQLSFTAQQNAQPTCFFIKKPWAKRTGLGLVCVARFV